MVLNPFRTIVRDTFRFSMNARGGAGSGFGITELVSLRTQALCSGTEPADITGAHSSKSWRPTSSIVGVYVLFCDTSAQMLLIIGGKRQLSDSILFGSAVLAPLSCADLLSANCQVNVDSSADSKSPQCGLTDSSASFDFSLCICRWSDQPC
eukprot:253417_1